MTDIDIDICKSIAYSVRNYIETAVGEIAENYYCKEDIEYDFPQIWKKLKNAKMQPRDWRGWLADELFNDAGIVSDLAGDKICNEFGARGIPWSEEAFGKVKSHVETVFPHIAFPKGW